MAFVLASSAGARLDSDLHAGGGTDDTAVLQGILDQARDGSPLHLIVDGPALVGGLDVHGNTTIEFTDGAGLYLRDGAHRAVLRNAHGSRDRRLDERIMILGGFFNGNREGQRPEGQKQPGRVPEGPRRDDDGSAEDHGGAFPRTLEFFGVNHLRIEGSTVWSSRAVAIWVANANDVTIRDVTVDADFPTYPGTASIEEQRAFISTHASKLDGIHFTGPASRLLLERLRLRTFDDALSFWANESSTIDGNADASLRDTMGPLLGQGPITDVVVRDVVLDDVLVGIRLVSCDEPLDRVLIENVSGGVRQRFAVLTHFGSPDTFGAFGTVTFRDITVEPLPSASFGVLTTDEGRERFPGFVDEAEAPLFSVNAYIDRLSLQKVSTELIDERPLVQIGSDSDIAVLEADFHVRNPEGIVAPFRFLDGARVRRLVLELEQSIPTERGEH